MAEEKNKVLLKKSNVLGKTPESSKADFGEVFVNYASGNGASFLATKKYDGTIAKFREDGYYDGKFVSSTEWQAHQAEVAAHSQAFSAFSGSVLTIIEENERVTATALTDINDRLTATEGSAVGVLSQANAYTNEKFAAATAQTTAVNTSVTELSGATIGFSGSVVTNYATKKYVDDAEKNAKIASSAYTDFKYEKAITSGASYTDSKFNTATGQTSVVDTRVTQLSGATSALSGSIINYVDDKLSAVYVYKGTKATKGDLPTSGNKKGDVWNVTSADGTIGTANYTPAGTNYAWDGTAWDPLGGTVDLSNYAKTSRVETVEGNVTALQTSATTLLNKFNDYALSATVNTTVNGIITIIEENERVTAAALNQLNDKVNSVPDDIADAIVEVEGEISAIRENKADKAHTHASLDVATMSGYTKPTATSAIAKTDSLNTAIGKLEKALDGKAGISHNQASNTITAMTDYSKPGISGRIVTGDSLNTAIGKLEKSLDGKANNSVVEGIRDDFEMFSGSVIELIEENEEVTASALNDLNGKIAGVGDTIDDIKDSIRDAGYASSAYTDSKINDLRDIIGGISDDVTELSGTVKTLSGNVVSYVNTKVSSAYIYKGTVTNYSNLPESGKTVGYVYNVTNAKGNPGDSDYTPAGTNYAWNGTAWDALGGTVDLSNYATANSVQILSQDIDIIEENIDEIEEVTSAALNDLNARLIALEASLLELTNQILN